MRCVLREFAAIAQRKKQAGLLVDDQIAIAWYVGYHGGNTGGHGFHEHVGLSFVTAAQPEAIEMRQQCIHVVAVSQKVHVVLDLDLLAVAFQQCALGTVAHDQQVRIAAGDWSNSAAQIRSLYRF